MEKVRLRTEERGRGTGALPDARKTLVPKNSSANGQAQREQKSCGAQVVHVTYEILNGGLQPTTPCYSTPEPFHPVCYLGYWSGQKSLGISLCSMAPPKKEPSSETELIIHDILT